MEMAAEVEVEGEVVVKVEAKAKVEDHVLYVDVHQD
jgi:hypothetical protein